MFVAPVLRDQTEMDAARGAMGLRGNATASKVAAAAALDKPRAACAPLCVCSARASRTGAYCAQGHDPCVAAPPS